MRPYAPYLLLIIGILVPQVLFINYWWIIVCWIVVGAGITLIKEQRRIFLKILIIEAVIAGILFYTAGEANAFYLSDAMSEVGVSSTWLGLIFILFNALNAAFVGLIGSALVRLMKPGKS